MKKLLLFLWLMMPLPVIVWHYGPGQKWLARDQAHALIQKAEQLEAQKNWREAETLFREAAGKIRGMDDSLQTQLDIALVRARYRQGSAVEAIDMADRLLNDPKFQRQPEPLQREARELASRIHYHAAWVMRLEGAQKDLWMEEAELARQNFRMLSETTLATAQTNFSYLQQTNLESAVRLQRMGLVELMAKPLPEEGQAMAGQGLTEQMARRRGQRGKGTQPGIGDDGDSREPQNGASNNRFQSGPGS